MTSQRINFPRSETVFYADVIVIGGVNVMELITSLQKKIEELEQIIEDLKNDVYYAPGGVEYNKGEERFEEYQKKDEQN